MYVTSDSIVVMSSNANGNVCDYDDDMRNEVKINKPGGPMTTLTYTKKTLSVLNYRRPYEKKLFPMLTFVKKEVS